MCTQEHLAACVHMCRTVDEARKAGAKVVSGVGRGRGLQMNAGAAQAQGELLCFLHADTSVPPDMVGCVMHAA